jgi:hypothetical protein
MITKINGGFFMEAMVLLYNAEGARREEIAALAAHVGIGLRVVEPREYGETLGALCGLGAPSGRAAGGAGFSDEMLLLAFLTKEQFHAFLDGFRERGIRGVPLKAMLTPTNAEWDSCRLHNDLSAEYEAFKRMKQEKGGA